MNIIDPSPIMKNVIHPTSIALTITHKCNLNCIHCFNNSHSSMCDDMSDEELIEVARHITELSPITVCLCGGEPILRGEVVFEILKIMKGKVGAINIVSNGYDITLKTLQRLKDNGIALIQFSLDGASAVEHDTFRRKNGAFDRVINSIKNAKSVGLSVGISFVPNKLNNRSISKTIEICRNLGVDIFRVMPMIPMGRGANAEFLVPNSDEYIQLQQTLESEKKNNSMYVEWGDPIDHLHRMPLNYKKGFPAYALEIRYDGKITPSSYLPITVGDAKELNLSEFWHEKLINLWGNEEIVKLATSIENIYNFNNFPKCPFSKDGDYRIELT